MCGRLMIRWLWPCSRSSVENISRMVLVDSSTDGARFRDEPTRIRYVLSWDWKKPLENDV